MNLCNPQFMLVLLCIVGLGYVSTQDALECQTPDRRRGICINIKRCPPILTILQSPSRDIEFLQKSQCGFDKRDPLVCCPVTTTTEFTPIVTLPSFDLSFPDVSYHPNLRRLFPRSCGVLTEDNKITNGDVTILNEFPWMALLGYGINSPDRFLCGGSLINRRYVLTAAHCLKSRSSKLEIVRLGEHNLDSDRDCQENFGCAPPVQDIPVEEIIPHPEYNNAALKNDIGLIRLSRDVTFTTAISPVCLPVGRNQQQNTLEGQTVTVTGWGKTEFGSYSPILLKVNVPVVPLQQCSRTYNKTKAAPIDRRQICAGGVDGKDSCPGDSGGPLHILGQSLGGPAFIQMGIVSFGPRNCGAVGLPGVYTNVGYYMQWILDNMRP